MCNCHSYNGKFGTEKEVILDFLISITTEGEKKYKKVCIDACIADTIQSLWDNGVSTINSCCGHGKRVPEIVFDTAEEAVKAREVLKKIDDRKFQLSFWTRAILI